MLLKQGVMNILRWVQSKSEYENVLQHCSLNLGEKKYPDWKIKHKQLAIRMYFGDTSTVSLGKVTMISDGFGETFENLYPSLSENPMAGYPFIANDSRDYVLVKDSISRNYYPNQKLV